MQHLRLLLGSRQLDKKYKHIIAARAGLLLIIRVSSAHCNLVIPSEMATKALHTCMVVSSTVMSRRIHMMCRFWKISSRESEQQR